MDTSWRGLALAALAGIVLQACGVGDPSDTGAATGELQVSDGSTGRDVESSYVRVADGGGRFLNAGNWRKIGSPPTSGLFVSRVGASQLPEWTLRLETRSSAIMHLAPSGDGGCIATGWFSGSLSLEERPAPLASADGLAEMFLLAIGPTGHLEWSATTSTEGEHPYSTGDIVAVGDDGSCVVAGNTRGRSSFSERRLDVTGADDRERGFLARYTADGRVDWAQAVPGRIDTDRGAALAISEEHGIAVVSRVLETHGCLLSSYSNDGQLRWVQRTHGGGSAAGTAAAVAPDGSWLVAGWFMDDVEFGDDHHRIGVESRGAMDLFLVRYGPDGAVRWVRTGGGTAAAYARGRGMELAPDGTIEVQGVLGGNIRFDCPSGPSVDLVSSAIETPFAVRFSADGHLLGGEVEPASQEGR